MVNGSHRAAFGDGTVAASAAGRLLYLDLVRGLAALAVMIYHVSEGTALEAWLGSSFLAVDLFFLMSGYVIARAYADRMADGRVSRRRFVWNRVIRLYPLYVLASALGAAYFGAKMVLAVPDAPTWSQIAEAVRAGVVMVPAFGAEAWGFGQFPFAPSAWSLSFEFWFSILFAATLIHARSAVLLAVAAGAFAVLVAEAFRTGSVDMGWWHTNLGGGVARFWLSFLIGVLVWRHGPAPQDRASLWPLPLALAALAAVSLPHEAVAAQLAWVTIVAPALLLVMVSAEPPRWLRAAADHSGRLSYGIYIFHAPVFLLTLGGGRIAGLDPASHPELMALIACALSIAAAAPATYWIDEPIRRRIARLATASNRARRERTAAGE
jgi:peptidoglycan/LPS O-acetylase OafA/YrhL